ncbi:MAG: HD domain-containing protein [Deltaproteobacteria bacterium]|nr:HD domain-containing protein [Deltaproteobacteria bacterium]
MLLRDPVHGLISFEQEEELIIPRLLEAPEVQRLRRIRQLGLTSLAFPGAEHTRFSHALGAAHVMQLFVARLRKVHDELPFWQRLTSERARDALAAALLHDVGHGPLSHLFEDAVAHATGTCRAHEDWTEQVLLDEGTEVHRILARDDPELPRRVAGLVRGEHQLPYLARAVSGTFDVDRCDYLLRDAHATGVGYGDYDLPWLLRSLRFGESKDGSPPGLAIDGPKGMNAIESFILARLFMFQQVYFHKATRAAEWMIRAILRRAMHLIQDGVRLPATPPAMRAFAAGDTPSLGDYLALDDQALLETLNAWRDASDPVLADLCRRLRARELFKTEELYGEAQTPTHRERAHELVRSISEEAGLAADYYTGLDVATDTPYAEDSSLTVIFGNGRPRRPTEVSFVLDRLANETLSRTRVVFPGELRQRIRDALGNLG